MSQLTNKYPVRLKYFVPLILLTVFIPAKILAFGVFDGGMIQKIESQCSCSGGQTIRVQSYADESEHVYLYQPGATTLYMNYNISTPGNYFLATLIPFAMCLDSSEDCEGSSGQQPEGIFTQIGTSFKLNGQRALALMMNLPGLDQLSAMLSLFIPR